MPENNHKNKSLIESLAELSKDDPAFRKEMDVLFIETLQEFMASFQQGMQQANLDTLSFAIHKIKFAVQIYGIQSLYNEAEKGRQLIQSKRQTPQIVQQMIANVGQLCQQQINQLKQQLGKA
ncbi:hypothetical protein BKI52_01940 [marine bacterium AO1-C]|nr:hypothetical protein BKI52_01940 [marine bacterium AO1-C]